ncbi:hypothetical protein Salpa_5340 [Sporomusa sp. KB1]|nr:hypothetical protein Salpa_5340 [Sporomusa sp. KB1]
MSKIKLIQRLKTFAQLFILFSESIAIITKK